MSGLLDRLRGLWAKPGPVAAAVVAKPLAPSAAAFIAAFEGFSTVAYRCPAGVWTIGYGTTRYPDGRAVAAGDPACSKADALAWLTHDVASAEAAVRRLVTVPINEAQRAALVSLAYNIGAGAFERSTLLDVLNRGRYGDAGREFARWVKANGVVLPGLVKRRAAEAALFGGAP